MLLVQLLELTGHPNISRYSSSTLYLHVQLHAQFSKHYSTLYACSLLTCKQLINDILFSHFSVNLITCISSLCAIGRQRPLHIATVVQTFEVLQGAAK